MSKKETRGRAVARRLIAHAATVLPTGRSSWVQAMRNELDYIPEDATALRWAVGCLSACYMERIRNMMVPNLKTVTISRPVLTLEMVLCFFAPTLFLLDSLHNVVAAYSAFDGFTFVALCVTISLVGPAGLYFTFKFVVLGQHKISKAGTIALGILAAWALVGNLYAVSVLASPGYAWRGIILLSILPALGAAHLIYLANADRSQMATA